MDDGLHSPSLQEAMVYFADPNSCRDYVVRRRWPKGRDLSDMRLQGP